MGLKNFAQARATIKLSEDNELSLRGLSANDVLSIVYENKGVVEDVMGLAERAGITKKLPDDNGLMEFIGQASLRAPYLVACIIAHASDEPDEFENAAKLPMPTQFDALREIARLTFTDRAGFERFVGNVKAALASVSDKLVPLTKGTK